MTRPILPLTAAMLLLAACNQADVTAPAAPFLDALDTFTTQPSIELSGTAEYGSTITVSGGTEAATTVADPYSARFRVTVNVPLAATTTLSVTATDEAGNVSEPATVQITQGDGVAIRNLRINGSDCDPAQFNPPGCPTTDGDLVDFVVDVADTAPISEVGYTAFFPSSQTSRSRTFFVANSVTQTSTRFEFTVNSNAPERVDIVATSVDVNGHRTNSAAVTLDVRFTAIGYGGHLVSDPLLDDAMVAPVDVAVGPAGEWIVLSAGNGRMLQRPAAGGSFTQLAAFTDMQFVTRAGPVPGTTADRYYVSRPGDGRVFQLDLNGGNLTAFADPNGQNARGLAVLGPVVAKGWIDVTAALDGDQVILSRSAPALTETWELDSNGSCTSSATLECVTIGPGATAAEKRDALVAAITGSALVSAFPATGGRLSLEALAAGEEGNQISLAKNPTGNAILLSLTALAEGHSTELYVANDGDNLVRRYTLDGGPFASGSNHGTFDTADVSYGVAARNVLASPSTDLGAFLLYTAGDPNNFGTLRARLQRVTATGGAVSRQVSTVFEVTGTNTGRIQDFQRLWDVVLTPAGCLLVSDEGAGAIYAADVRDPSITNPAVEVIAAGFDSPRGLALDAAGNLLVADFARHAIYVVSRTSATTDCF